MSRTRRVEIVKKSQIDHDFFKIEEARLRYERFDGTMSAEMVRLNLKRGDAVAAVVHDPAADTLVLVEQFRYSTYENGPGWLLELPAGVIEPEHDADPAATMRRELHEEIGYDVSDLRLIHTFYLSPGGSSERVFLYYARVSPQNQRSAGGGLLAENEDIRVLTLSTNQVYDRMARGEIQDAKTLVGLQWLRLQPGSAAE
ncbi:MAG: NUDIX hydrolase [Anaerolineae bacterium]|nr:NUDIX hydrolase [Anaerolineae bacterium]